MRTLALLFLSFLAAAQGPAPLFDGKTLDGWEVCNGYATYKVEDGTIVGTTAEGSPNSFLCTKKEYGDFVLELETLVDRVLNSGIQIRSHRYAQATGGHPAGRVYGYQVEISNEKSGSSGGIYDEARRGWLFNPADPGATAAPGIAAPHAAVNTAAATKAFKDNQWNRYRVEAVGDRMRVWVNDILTCDITDPADVSGFIALQVHSFKGDKPAQVRWRNIRLKDLGRHEWKPLFDGKTLEGWTIQGGGAWTVEDGAIHGKSTGDPRIGFVITNRSFSDVTARMKFRIARGNSGFFIRTQPPSMKGYEVELDAETRTGGLWEVGGRNWVDGPNDNAVVKMDGWNEMVASIHGRRVVFHVNGKKTFEALDDLAGNSQEGRIALQAHGAKRPTEVWFKDIEVLEKVR
jgi:hypothetical protein